MDKKRILFLDLMRVLALFMMIQGHTTYDFLDLTIRDGSSTGIKVWTSLRGYTAPFFMMVSGAVFTYLMLSQENKDGSNPRVKSGVNRIFTLLFWGYFLNFPIYEITKIFTKDGLNLFLTVTTGETFFTIFWITICLYIYKVLTNTENSFQENTLKKLFRDGALKHIKSRPVLFKKEYFEQEDKKKRLLTSVFWAVIISFPFLIISNVLTLEEKQRALRVDVLHIIAIGLLTIMMVYMMTAHKKWVMASSYFILMLIIISSFPLLNNVDLSHLPIFMAPYLNDFETKSMFPLTPWLAYIFAGALLGLWLNHEVKKEKFEKIIGYKLAAIGIGFIAISIIGDQFERYYYSKSYFWHDSPNLIYHRIGIVISVGSVMAFLGLIIKDLPVFVKQMTRNTLWLYVGHLIIIYQVIKPIIGYGTRFNVFTTLICIITMFTLMYFQTRIILFIQKNDGYVSSINKLYLKLKSRK